MNKKEMFVKIKTMNIKELSQYRSAAKVAGRLMSVLGVSTILLLLIYSNIITLISGSVLLYILGNMAANIGEVISVIEEHIVRLADK